MAITLALYASSGATTISTAEYSLTTSSTSIAAKTDTGIMTLVIDCSNMIAGDEYEFAWYEKAVSGGTQRKNYFADLIGVQADILLTFTPPTPLGYGWDFTAKRLAGADRTFVWTVRQVA